MRWAEAARCLARRVESLVELRHALATGTISWSMGEVLARIATPSDEARWLAFAQSRTVRQVQQHVDAERAAVRPLGETRTVAHSPTAEPSSLTAGGDNVARDAVERPTVRAAVGQDAGVRDAGVRDAPGRDAGVRDAADDELGHWTSGAGPLCTLTYTVDREDAWLYEATRCLLEQLGERDGAAQSEALLAEAQDTLLMRLPPGAIDVVDLQEDQERHAAQQRRVEQLRRSRVEAERACENNFRGELLAARAAAPSAAPSPWALAASLGLAPLEHSPCTVLDRQVRSVSAALARYELELSQLVLRFHRANGWRRLGYATEGQYALERLGLSRSSLAARRSLALRLERLPHVAAAFGAGQIGVEAALQLVRIATPSTEAAWVARASRRTIKHLREEVAAAGVAVRLAGERDCPPPDEDEMAAFQTLEQNVVSGRFGEKQSPEKKQSPRPAPAHATRQPAEPTSGAPTHATRPLVEPTSEARRAWCIMLASLDAWLAGGLQTSAAVQTSAAEPRAVNARSCSRAGRVTLRLRMARETRAWWRALETQARRWLPRGMSWLRFLCLSLWRSWRHLLGTQVAYGHIYIRDRFRCTSPVCNRRDVTPHHIQFRSAGGSDEDHNVTSPCTWCHLHGIHGGRIRATGTAARIRWELGPRNAPTLIVHGREKMAA